PRWCAPRVTAWMRRAEVGTRERDDKGRRDRARRSKSPPQPYAPALQTHGRWQARRLPDPQYPGEKNQCKKKYSCIARTNKFVKMESAINTAPRAGERFYV